MPENVRFSYGGVVFIGLNVPGSNNNLVLSDKECTHRAHALWRSARRVMPSMPSGTLPISIGCAAALPRPASSMRPVWWCFSGRPGFDPPETEDVDESTLPQYKGYRALMQALTGLTEQYAGQVLLVHGDTHFFKVDKPLYSPTRCCPI